MEGSPVRTYSACFIELKKAPVARRGFLHPHTRTRSPRAGKGEGGGRAEGADGRRDGRRRAERAERAAMCQQLAADAGGSAATRHPHHAMGHGTASTAKHLASCQQRATAVLSAAPSALSIVRCCVACCCVVLPPPLEVEVVPRSSSRVSRRGHIGSVGCRGGAERERERERGRGRDGRRNGTDSRAAALAVAGDVALGGGAGAAAAGSGAPPPHPLGEDSIGERCLVVESAAHLRR
jgi:hypothetical protein